MRTPEAAMRTTPNTIASRKMKSRACESCLKSPAMWFCPADDAFLCHSCDSSVHSANGLAARHNRVPLQTTSFHDDLIPTTTTTATPTDQPTWHNGFQKKARTPRHHPKKGEMMKKNKKTMMMMSSVVPEMSGDEEEGENYGEDEENTVFSVPTFDSFDHMDDHEDDISNLFGFGGLMNDHDYMESLLLEGTDEDQLIYCSSTVPSIVTSKETDSDRLEGVDEDQVVYCNSSTTPLITDKETGSERPMSELEEEEVVKIEVEDGIDHESSTCEDEFDFWALELENEVLMSNNIEVGIKGNIKQGEYHEKKEEEEEGNYNYLEMEGNSNKKKILLRLNYEDVINSWFGSSPWTTGIRPEFDHLDPNGWPNCMGNVESMDGQYRDERRVHGNGRDDDGREARVLRYREKRRTRLFSKKIRYQVRKLNAEKRPRLKGRFVKRTSSLTQTPPLAPHFPYTINK